jgi:hypothetical protein
MLKATVSGSFHRHMAAIYETVGVLRALSVEVLSPSDPRIVDHIGEFLFVASDRLRSIRLVQDRHLAAIRASDFLWVVCPDGYTGPSTSLEIGTAIALGVPVFSTSAALDITIGEYVQQVSGLNDALYHLKKSLRTKDPELVLLDPETSVDRSIDLLGDLRETLVGRNGVGRSDAERRYFAVRQNISRVLGFD